MSKTDELLIAEARGGDDEALGQLLQRHWEPGCRLALRYTRDAAAAQDVVQEAFVQVLRTLHRFDERRSFRAWFHGCVHNVALSQARSGARRRVREERAPAAAPARAASGLRLDLEEALGRLGQEVREAVELHLLGELTYREVAAAVGCPEGTAASRIRRGMSALRESLAGAAPALSAAALSSLLTEGGPRFAPPTASALRASASTLSVPPRAAPPASPRAARPLALAAGALALGAAVLAAGQSLLGPAGDPRLAGGPRGEQPPAEQPAREQPSAEPRAEREGPSAGAQAASGGAAEAAAEGEAGAPAAAGQPAPLRPVGALEGEARAAGDGVLWAHGFVFGVAFSPMGDAVAVGGFEELSLYDARTWRRLRSWPVAECHAIAFSPDGRTLVASSLGADGVVVIEREGAGGRRLSGLAAAIAVLVGPEGAWIAAGGPEALALWRGDEIRPRWVSALEATDGRGSERPVGVRHLGVAPDGALVSSHGDGRLRRWSVEDGTLLATSPELAGGFEHALTASGRLATSGEGVLRLHDDQGRPLATHPAPGKLAAVDPAGRRAVTLQGGTLSVFDLGSGERVATIDTGWREVVRAALDVDGDRVLALPAGSQALRGWSLPEARPLHEPAPGRHGGRVTALALAAGRLVSAAEDGGVRVWDASEGRLLHALELGWVPYKVLLSEDGGTALVSGLATSAPAGNRLELLDLASGARLGSAQAWGMHALELLSGERALTYEHAAGTLALVERDLRTGEVLRRVAEHGSGEALCYSPTGLVKLLPGERTVVVASPEGTPRARVSSAAKVVGAALSPDGRALLLADERGSLARYELGEGEARGATWSRSAGEGVLALALTPDGERLLVSSDGGLELWDAASGRTLRTLVGHRAPVTALVLSPDGRWAYTGGFDRQVLRWDLHARDEASASPR